MVLQKKVAMSHKVICNKYVKIYIYDNNLYSTHHKHEAIPQTNKKQGVQIRLTGRLSNTKTYELF